MKKFNPSKLKDLRAKLRMNQASLSKATGVSQSNISYYEQPGRSLLVVSYLNEIIKLANSRGVNIDISYFLED